MKQFNLNADMAEGYGPWEMGDDGGLLDIVQTANIACGFHAGDFNIMARTMAAAAGKGVGVGAHPGFHDLHGFGRRQMHLPEREIENLVAYQVGASLGIAAQVGATVGHVKPHGALNNMACADRSIAGAIARSVKAVDPGQILLAPALSELAKAGEKAGLGVVEELFADRAYMPDGQLAPRSRPDALVHDPAVALGNCIRMLDEGLVTALDGTEIKVGGRSICVHGDGPSAVAMARHVRDGLEAAGFAPAALGELLAG